MPGQVVAVCISPRKGEKKIPVPCAELRPEHGMVGDAHAGNWHRQVSLLAVESIDKMRRLGLDVGMGDFAENITTAGVDLVAIPIGGRLKIGETVLEVTQIGKECHNKCAIYHKAGHCVMPAEGIFARVLAGGSLQAGDPVTLVCESLEAG